MLRDWNIIKVQEGTFSPEVRKWRANFVFNYDFQEGFQRGFGIGFNVHYQSSLAIGFPIEFDSEGVAFPIIDSTFFDPEETNWGFSYSYRTRIFDDKDLFTGVSSSI